MASGNLVMHSPASQGLQIDSTFESIDSQRVCPLFPCAFDYRERRFKKLLRTLTHTMKSMFLPHIRGASLDKRVELLETAFAEKSPLLHQSMPADREWKLGGIVLDDVCGFYLRQLFLSLVTVDEESGLTSSLQTTSSSSFSEDNYDMQEQPRLHPSYELYENFRIVLKKFPRAAQFVDQDGLSLLHHLTLFYTSNVDRRYRYDALDEENTTLFRVIQILIRLCYVSAPSMAILFAKTDRGFATPVHILLTSGNNNDVDYELLHQMIVDNPTAAR